MSTTRMSGRYSDLQRLTYAPRGILAFLDHSPAYSSISSMTCCAQKRRSIPEFTALTRANRRLSLQGRMRSRLRTCVSTTTGGIEQSGESGLYATRRG